MRRASQAALRLLAVLAVGAIAPPALSQDVGGLTVRDEAYVRAIVGLDFKKHQQVMKELGITPKDDVLSCVCHAAAYGSSSTHQFYHPDTIGDYDRRYSCNHPGEPCVVSGWGCTRHPFPRDVSLWVKCQAKFPESGLILEEIAKQGRKIGGGKGDLSADLEDCRKNYKIADERNELYYERDGYAYLKRKGVRLLKEPPSIAKLYDDHEARAIQIATDKLRAHDDAAREKLETALLDTVGGQLFADAKVKERAIAAASAAAAVADYQLNGTKLEILRLERESREMRRQFAAYPAQKADAIAGNEKKIRALKADGARYQRDKSQLESFATGLTVANDIMTLEKKLNTAATSGKTKDRVDVLVTTAATAQSYLTGFVDKQNALGQAAREALESGVSSNEFQRFTAVKDKVKAVNTLNNALSQVVSLGQKGLQVYGYYEKYVEVRGKAEERARSGEFSAANAAMLEALDYASAAGEIGADFLPPIASDYAQFYAEALKMPGSALALINKERDKADVLADIKGSQAGSDAIKYFHAAFPGAHLDREPYLFREAGLFGYALDKGDSDKADLPRYAVIPDQDIAPFYLDERGYDALRQAAYLYPIATGKRMSDADVLKLLVDAKGRTPDISELKKQADAALRQAAEDKAIADRMGIGVLKPGDAGLFHDFRMLMLENLPALCVLSPSREKKLFGAYREQAQRDAVVEYITNYGAKLKEAEALQKERAAAANNGGR